MYKLYKFYHSQILKVLSNTTITSIGRRGTQSISRSHLKMGTRNAQFTVSVEGNIGCGKTTLLNYFSRLNDVEVLHEPVNKWTNINNHNLLDLLYKNPMRWSHVFQSYVQLTMVEQHMKPCFKHTKIMERSLHSARHCFVENLFRSGNMSDPEYQVYCEWFKMLTSLLDCNIDLIVYLRTDPTILNERILTRNREEEKKIPFEYLQSLHNLHEEWLLNSSLPNSTPVLVLDANGSLSQMQTLYVKHAKQILYGDIAPPPKVLSSPSKTKNQHRHFPSHSAAAVN